MISSNELLALSRLALSGKESDVRLYLAKMVRKLRKVDSQLGSEIEALLKSQPARAGGVLRRDIRKEDDSLFESNSDSAIPLLKSFDNPFSGEEPLLDRSLRQTLENILEERNSSELLAASGLTPASSIIFQGPPGVGKTMTARWLAKKLGLPFYVLDLTAVMSSYLGKTGSNLRKVIDFAKSHPCVLLLDEIDAIAKRRSDEADVGELKRLVTVMLQELEEWPTGGLLIAATNHPELVDPALWRRFDVEVTFENPSQELVKEAVTNFLESDAEEFSSWIDLIQLSLAGTSFSNIRRVVYSLRKMRILNPKGFEQNIIDFVFPDIESKSRAERIELAVKAVSETGMPQQKAAKLFGCSRDTIRKRLS
ncbi:ATP-binding protein [Vibrio cholerae]|uniref:AAA family ATPase n=1 Tax=Vibrio cholerae TaxID=666 RepID=A0A543Y4G5_VIBCL|nr:ATP-binding protein [Vibrio cholerae]KQA22677.1 ATPase AAA [Vibrio paracholerae 877-163]GHW88366.1 putative ATPase [Vibrio metoecus]EGR1020550.1 AAA family ATPase [Vibrio cholerae]EGR4071103.1 AAA family ATPase [Vibrio cholerae]EGR4117340.1 AAA family ATPase [Vibrio cholerae]